MRNYGISLLFFLLALSGGWPGAAMPNVFTPNGDGTNDELRPALYGSFKTWSLTVYDNVGREVFSTSNPLEGWDGAFRGSDAPAGGLLLRTARDRRKRP